MNGSAPARAAAPVFPGRIILGIGLLAGALDISDNLIYNLTRGITPKMVFQYIASGLIGLGAALRLGAASVALGVAMHFAIALGWTVLFYAASRRLAFLLRRPLVWGPVYGLGVYLFMNLVAVPLSRVPHVASAVTLSNRINGVLAVVLLIGTTIALLSSRYLPAG